MVDRPVGLDVVLFSALVRGHKIREGSVTESDMIYGGRLQISRLQIRHIDTATNRISRALNFHW